MFYREKQPLNEFHRMSFTHFRLSSHSLAVETGRWNRRGRGSLPLEERVCTCGDGIETERHVAAVCRLTHDIWSTDHLTTLENLFFGLVSDRTLCQIIHEILFLFK